MFPSLTVEGKNPNICFQSHFFEMSVPTSGISAMERGIICTSNDVDLGTWHIVSRTTSLLAAFQVPSDCPALARNHLGPITYHHSWRPPARSLYWNPHCCRKCSVADPGRMWRLWSSLLCSQLSAGVCSQEGALEKVRKRTA